jgi:hypothetical protein
VTVLEGTKDEEEEGERERDASRKQTLWYTI